MPRQTDQSRKQARQVQLANQAGLNPTQQLAARMKQVVVKDEGPVPPPPTPAGSPPAPTFPAESPSQPDSLNVPQVQPGEMPAVEPGIPEQQLAQSDTEVSRDHQETIIQQQPPVDQMLRELPQLPAAQNLLYQLLNQNRGQSQGFHLVIVPDDDNPKLLTYATIEELIAGVREHLDTPTSLFPFLGNPMRVSKGPNRYLDTPFGTLPLFVLPPSDSLEFDSDGFVGLPSPDLAPPVADGDDELDDEEESDEEVVEIATTTAAVQESALQEDSPVFPPDG